MVHGSGKWRRGVLPDLAREAQEKFRVDERELVKADTIRKRFDRDKPFQTRCGPDSPLKDIEPIFVATCIAMQRILLPLNQKSFLNFVKAMDERIRPILSRLYSKIKQPFAVIGSWAARQFVHACRDIGESVGPSLEQMVANDIDCFFGTPGSGPFAMNGMPRKEMMEENDVNWVEVHHFSVAGLLANNDINATAFALGVEEKNGSLAFEVKVSPQFWRFFLSDDHILCAVRPKQAKTRTLVRLAFKSLEMRLPFNDCAIDAKSEKLPLSQKEKIDRLNQEWQENPLSAFTLQRNGSAYTLRGTHHLAGDVHHPPIACDDGLLE
jgi:hypothetical protein